MAQSLFGSLKANDECEIDVLAPAWSLPILARMPEVRRSIVMPLGHGRLGLTTRWHLGKELARESYNQSIVLPGSFKSALVPFFARIPQRTGFRGEMRYGLINDMRLLDCSLLPMTVQRFVALGQARKTVPAPVSLPMPRLHADSSNQEALRMRFKLDPARPAIAFMPGAEYGPAKQWPSVHYAKLAHLLAARGFQIWVLGSEKDSAVARPIASGNPTVIDFTGHTSLGDAVDLIALARAAVCNDSGLMHVAAALDVPLVALFGSSNPEHTPPLGHRVVIETLRLPCAPCFERQCPFDHTQCLTGITPEKVLTALEPFIDANPSPLQCGYC
ncbi:MAG: lipopolysaccharide heptosyltransferase II [Betaproteobacteria bacterium]|nr:lipopolysaccharide heptosyltransferase II [Betaproteobacteria bacterium]